MLLLLSFILNHFRGTFHRALTLIQCFLIQPSGGLSPVPLPPFSLLLLCHLSLIPVWQGTIMHRKVILQAPIVQTPSVILPIRRTFLLPASLSLFHLTTRNGLALGLILLLWEVPLEK